MLVEIVPRSAEPKVPAMCLLWWAAKRYIAAGDAARCECESEEGEQRSEACACGRRYERATLVEAASVSKLTISAMVPPRAPVSS